MECWCHVWSRFRFTPSDFSSHISLASPSTRRMREQKSKRQKQSNRKCCISRQRTQPKPSACPGCCPLAEVAPVGWHFKPPITPTPTSFCCPYLSYAADRLPLRLHLHNTVALICCQALRSARLPVSSGLRLDVSLKPTQMLQSIDLCPPSRSLDCEDPFFCSTVCKVVMNLINTCVNCKLIQFLWQGGCGFHHQQGQYSELDSGGCIAQWFQRVALLMLTAASIDDSFVEEQMSILLGCDITGTLTLTPCIPEITFPILWFHEKWKPQEQMEKMLCGAGPLRRKFPCHQQLFLNQNYQIS